jgi:O-antigen ligase
MIDKCAMIPISVCVYAAIVGPLIDFMSHRDDPVQDLVVVGQLHTRILWPAMAASSVALAALHRSRLSRLTWPPHIICLFAYLVLAGASVLWAFRPELSAIRFAQQVMILTSIVLPAMLAARTTDIMRALFLCFAFGLVLNIFLDHSLPGSRGFEGYFMDKNALGQFAAIVFLLAIQEMLYPGLRQALGIIVVLIAASLLYISNSRTSFAFACVVPFLAGLLLVIRKTMRISPAIVLLSIAFCYEILSWVFGFNANRLSMLLFGEETMSGRTFIWDFADVEIGRRPLLGWGYQSFWLVGPDAPSLTDASGWIKFMPNAHNGYVDTILETGYTGFVLLMIFIFTTFHAIGRVADRDPTRAQLLISLALFVVLNNLLESAWLRGSDLLWVMFVIVAAEIGRCWQPLPPTSTAHRLKAQRSGGPGPSQARRAVPGLRHLG